MSSQTTCFGLDANLFVYISPDSRLHLWDVEAKREKQSFVDKNHLSHDSVFFSWQQATKEKPGHVIVGFTDGIAIAWDLNRGVITRSLSAVNDATPTDAVFSNDGKTVFVGYSQQPVLQYDLATGDVIKTLKVGKKGALKLAVNPKVDVLAVCSSSIKIVEVASGRKRKLNSPLPGGASAVKFTSCGRFLVAAAARSREVLLFDIRADVGIDGPALVMPVKGEPMSLDVRNYNDSAYGNALEILCVFRDDGAEVLRWSTNYKENASESVNSVISQTSVTSNGPILSGYFGKIGDRLGNGVVFATGSFSNPSFEHVHLCDGDGNPMTEVSLNKPFTKANAQTMITNDGQVITKTSDASFAPEVLGPHEMGGQKRPILSDTNSVSDSKKSRKNSPDGNSLGNIVVSTDTKELSLQQRLEALSSDMVNLENYGETGFQRSHDLPNGTAVAVPTSDSLVILVEQALQSGDDALLEQCFACSDSDIVEATARRLPSGRIVQFLRKLVAKFEKRPSRSVLLTQWLSALLRFHTAYLVTLPDLSVQLAGLSQMLERRLDTYAKMSSLAGRLDLLMSQVSYGSGVSGNSKGAVSTTLPEQLATIQPAQIYRED